MQGVGLGVELLALVLLDGVGVDPQVVVGESDGPPEPPAVVGVAVTGAQED